MPSIARHQRREPGGLIGRRQNQLAVLRKTPPRRKTVRTHPVTLGNLANRHPGPQGLRHNPRLEIIWPPQQTSTPPDRKNSAVLSMAKLLPCSETGTASQKPRIRKRWGPATACVSRSNSDALCTSCSPKNVTSILGSTVDKGGGH